MEYHNPEVIKWVAWCMFGSCMLAAAILTINLIAEKITDHKAPKWTWKLAALLLVIMMICMLIMVITSGVLGIY